MNLIHAYCQKNQINLTNIFGAKEENYISSSMITYDQFQDGLKRAKITFPVAEIENIMKYLVSISFAFYIEYLLFLI